MEMFDGKNERGRFFFLLSFSFSFFEKTLTHSQGLDVAEEGGGCHLASRLVPYCPSRLTFGPFSLCLFSLRRYYANPRGLGCRRFGHGKTSTILYEP